MMFPYLLALLLAIGGSIPLCAQSTPLNHTPRDTTGTGIVAGYHGWGNHHLELGYASLPSPAGSLTDLGYTISGTVRLGGKYPVGTVVVGAIVSVWASAQIGPGVNLEYFRDFRMPGYALRLRPELAWRLPRIHFAYGYPLTIASHCINGLNTHNLSVRVFFPR